jgi:hypothetical protein
LQRVENEAGSFVFDPLRKQEAQNLLKSHLDGVGVFENGKSAGTWAPQGGRSTLHAVDFDVLTAIRAFRLLPPSSWSCGMMGLRRK